MRILHTSDWHLGRAFHGASRLPEQREVLRELTELVAAEGVELVLVAGDLYDRAIPGADAVELLGEALTGLQRTGARVVAVAGNHDSAVRVGFGEELMAAAGVVVRGDPARAGLPVEVPTTDGGPPVLVYPVPYLDPVVARRVFAAELAAAAASPGEAGGGGAGGAAGGAGGRLFDDDLRVLVGGPGPAPVGGPSPAAPTHEAVLRVAVDRARAHRRARGPARAVLVAHAFVAGAEPSASERELSVGGTDRVPAGALAGFDYVALGHLHQSQLVRGGPARYSGAPLAYSFAEAGSAKGSWLVDLRPDGTVDARFVPVRAGRPLATVEGPLDDLLTSPRWATAEGAWVRAVLTDAVLPMGAMDRLQRRFPSAVVLEHRPPGRGPAGALAARRAVRSDLELAAAFLAEELGTPPDDDDLLLVKEAFSRLDPDGAPPCVR